MILIPLLFIYSIPSIYAMEYADAEKSLYSLTYNVPYKKQYNTSELICACSETKKSLFLFHDNKAISVFNTDNGEKTKTITKHIPQASDWICTEYCKCYLDWPPEIWDTFYASAAAYDENNNLLCVAKQRGHEYALLAYTIKGSHAKNSYLAPQVTKFSGHADYVTDMALTTNGLASIATDKMIKIWDMPTATCSNTIAINKPAKKIVPFDHNSLLSIYDNSYANQTRRTRIYQWDTRNNQCTNQFTNKTSIKALSVLSEYNFLSAEYFYRCEYDEKYYIVIDQQTDSFINNWDIRTGTILSRYTIPNRKKFDYIAALTHYKHYIVALTRYGFLHIWDSTSSSNEPIQSIKLLAKKNYYTTPSLTKLNDDSLLVLGKNSEGPYYGINVIKLSLTQ